LNRQEAIRIFEESWNEFVNEYHEARMLSTFCSEADVESHLTHKLLGKLPSWTVHTQLPIPLEIERLSRELFVGGRIAMKKCIKPDIVIIDPLVPELYVVTELKFTSIYWGYLPFYLALEKELDEEAIEELKKGLRRSIDYLARVRAEKPTQQDIEKTYFGKDKQGRTNIGKLIGILNDFEKKEKEIVAGYLCVIDEIYPNIQEILQEAIKKYNPPSQFKILAEHFTVYEDLQKTLEKL